MHLFDVHNHLDDPRFDADREAAVRAARGEGVQGFVVAGYGPERWERQREVCAGPLVAWPCYGLHPWAAARAGDEDGIDRALVALDRFLDGTSAVGLGETGLDASRSVPDGSLPLQERAFRGQLRMARERDLPLVLHVLRAHEAALAVVREEGVPVSGGMVHSFSGSPEQARAWVRLGLHVSIGPSVCHPRSDKVRAACRAVPADRLLIETDCPDQAPWPDGGARNEPAWLVRVALAAAAARREDPAALGLRCARNAVRLFGLPLELPP